MQADLATLDTVANLWSLSGDLSREDYRKFILSPYFSERRRVMDTIMLVHRIQPSHQEAYETHPDAVRARAACCNSSEYDIPSQHVVCRSETPVGLHSVGMRRAEGGAPGEPRGAHISVPHAGARSHGRTRRSAHKGGAANHAAATGLAVAYPCRSPWGAS